MNKKEQIMINKRIALLLCVVLALGTVFSGPGSSNAFAGEPGSFIEEAEVMTEEGDIADGSLSRADVIAEDKGGEKQEASEDTLSEGTETGADPDLISILEKQGLKRNNEGRYEYTDESGNVITYDPEDPEIFKYFNDEEPAEENVAEDFVIDKSLMAAGGLVHSDPYLFPLDGRYYSYPKYYRTDDGGNRVGIRYGMDISKFQNVISESNFRKLKDDYMIDFVFIRAGYRGYGSSGSLGKDECFEDNLRHASNAGLAVGVYFFSQAISRTEAREEAEYCMDIIGSYKDRISLPVVIDYEYSGNPGRLKAADLSASRHTEIVNAFCDEVADEGYTPMIYANKSMFQSDMEVSDIPDSNLIWLANYVDAGSNGVYSTSYSGRLSAWQFTSKYSQFGTTGLKLVGSQYLDMNFWYGYFPGEACKVTFATNGGSKVPSQTLARGDKVKKPSDPTRTGYTFEGWYKDKECTKEWDFDSDKVKKDTTIYAKWKIITYTVSFVTEEEYEVAPQRTDYGKKVKEPVLSLPSGYHVEGWYKEKEYRNKWNFAKDTVKGDMTLYGKIEADTVKLIYHDNGGWGSMEPSKGLVNETVTVEENTFTREGYTYVSWNTAPDGSGEYYKAGDRYFLKPSGNDLYAIWKADIYKVIFDPGMGRNTISVNAACDSMLTEPDIEPQKDMELSGWYLDSGFKNRWDFDSDRVKRDLTLYAKWVVSKEDMDWGDLGKEENSEIRKLYDSPKDVPEGLWVYGIEDKEYTGVAVTQDIKVFYGKEELPVNSGYTVKYSANKSAGEAKLTVTGKGNYSGTYTRSFNISPVSISNSDVLSVPDISLGFTGKVQKGKTSVNCLVGGKTVTLKAGTDYALSYPRTDSSAEDYDSRAFVGYKSSADTTDERGYEEYQVKITGMGNYTGEAFFTERIVALDKGAIVPVTKLKIQAIPAGKLEYDDDGRVKPVTPEVIVKNGNEELKAVSANSAEDGYSLIYRNNFAAGKASVLICGHGRYTGIKSVSFKINSIPITKATLMQDKTAVKTLPAKEYTGSEITHEGLSLFYNGEELAEGRDYSISYANNINAGSKASIIFTGKGIYSGKLTKNFTINRIPLEKEKNGGRVFIYMDRSAPYRLNGAKPGIEIVYKDDVKEEILINGQDYSLKYSNNKTVNDASDPKKIPTVTITGKGNYSGTLKESFRVTTADLEGCTAAASDLIYSSKAGSLKPKMQIKDADGTALKAGTDYDNKILCSYRDETEITRSGTKMTVSANTSVDGKDIIPLGTAILATATGKGNYKGSSVSAVFRLVSVDITKAEVKTADKVYTGKPVTLENKDLLSVTLDGAALNTENIEIVPGSYVNNTNKGTAKVKIRGVGDYGGSKTISFKIKPRPVE